MKDPLANPRFTFNPDTHVYKYDGKRMTGVTTVLGVINKPMLVPWASNMAVDYVIEHASKESLTLMGVYLVHKDTLELARKAHQRKKEARGQAGSDTHALVEQYARECIANHAGRPFPTENYPPIQKFIDWALAQDDLVFLISEKVMYHPEWFVGGTADLVLLMAGKKYIVDLKTQKKIWDRVPFMQMSAYMEMLKHMGETDFHGSLIIHLPEEGELETHYSYDHESDLQAFLNALGLYRYLNNY
jgi:hypothetical protein